ncbi:MAG TPA: YicC/YloC family endoribonuclease [Desulfomonilaceae bacterium]|nr:YicC/YloC family endoribonuclease [Desulfomonilaceae bacterium]
MWSQGIDNDNPSIKSMTGFGYGRKVLGEVEIKTEIRSVNHRFLDMSVRMPRTYSLFEPEVRKIVSNNVQRGKLDLAVTRTGGTGSLVDVVLDRALASAYFNCLSQLKEHFRLAGDITLSDMLRLSDIIVPQERQEAIQVEWQALEESLHQALAALDSMKRTEGSALWHDIKPRLLTIDATADDIGPLVNQVTVAVKERLEKRVLDLTGGLELDRERVLQEVALLADRADVTEELTRLKSHVQQFLSLGNEGSPVGRKMDFLLQELHREINTVGSKSASTEIAHRVVIMKTELEKIREQIQNIE